MTSIKAIPKRTRVTSTTLSALKRIMKVEARSPGYICQSLFATAENRVRRILRQAVDTPTPNHKRALHHAVTYRDAIKLALDDIEPNTLHVVPRRTTRAPGESSKLATARIRHKYATRREQSLIVAYEDAKDARDAAFALYERIRAEYTLATIDAEESLAERRLVNPDARNQRGVRPHIHNLYIQAVKARRVAIKAQQRATTARARLARCRASRNRYAEQITVIEKNFYLPE
jgi:hypothetical protein